MKNISNQLIQKGFAIFPSIDVDLQNILLQFAQNKFDNSTSLFHTSHFIQNTTIKKEIHDFIKDLLTPFVKTFFPNYDITICNYMIKPSGENSAVPLHSDWSYVKEKKQQSYSIWIPLCDINESNGGFGIIPFSHKIISEKRGPNIYVTNKKSNSKIIDKYGEKLALKSGEVLVYNHKLLHFSGNNNSSIIRFAVNVSITPKNFTNQLHHYYYIKEKKVTRKYYSCDTAFYLNCQYGKIPLGNNFEKTPNSKQKLNSKLLQLSLYKKLYEFKQYFNR